MTTAKIPKIVQYCWFGGKEKPENVQKCIRSWKQYLKDYQFIEWNENNFDVEAIPYSKEAYEEKKYAFVSDVARVQGLLKYGGIYMDTDVEVYKDFENILNHECVLGFEEKNYIATSFMAAVPNHPLIKMFCDLYSNLNFRNEEGIINTETNVQKLTELLKSKGLICNGTKQEIDQNIVVYPQEYFSPYDYINCYLKKTEKTYCVHHFFVSWMPWHVKFKKILKRWIVGWIGPDKMNGIREHFFK